MTVKAADAHADPRKEAYEIPNQSPDVWLPRVSMFTCDLTTPFRILDHAGRPMSFDIVTSWEVLEHIPEDRISQLLENIRAHLRPKGIFVASVALFECNDPDSGEPYHVTLKPRDWWEAKFNEAGMTCVDGLIDTGDCVRGSGNGPSWIDWDAQRDPDLGFQLVARLSD